MLQKKSKRKSYVYGYGMCRCKDGGKLIGGDAGRLIPGIREQIEKREKIAEDVVRKIRELAMKEKEGKGIQIY